MVDYRSIAEKIALVPTRNVGTRTTQNGHAAAILSMRSRVSAKRGTFAGMLPQKRQQRRHQLHGSIHLRTAAAGIRADADEILGLGMHGQDFPQFVSRLLMAGVRHFAADTADAAGDADGRIVAALGQTTLQNDVAIEQAARGVGDRLVEIVAVHQHGEDAGDAAGRRRCRVAPPCWPTAETPTACSRVRWAARRAPTPVRAEPSPGASGCRA